MSFDMSQFYQVFFEETAEHLASMENLLLNLDVEAPSMEDLNAIFRAAHSIKGGSGTFGFTDMTGVTHILEGLLDKLRKETLSLRPEMVDAFLAAGDVLRAQLAHHQGGPEVDPGEVAAACARLDNLALVTASPGSGRAGTAPAAAEPRRLWLECAIPAGVAEDAGMVDTLLTALRELASVDLEHRPAAGDNRLTGWLTTTREEAELRDALSFYAFPEDILFNTSGPAEGEAHGLPGADPAAATATDAAFGFFGDTPGQPVAAGPTAPAESTDSGFGFFDGAPGGPDSGHASGTAVAEEGDGFGLFINAPGLPPAPAATASPGRRGSDDPQVERAVAGRRTTDKTVMSPAGEASSIRVSVDKVDQLINLVGELVITQAMIADAAGYLDPGRGEKLLASLDLLSRNTRDLQESVMSIRMLPMSMVFSRFPRVVRDLAGKLGKQVELRTLGEGTELDKGLIEKITDPLTHLVRNSLDHGIEAPEQRVMAGKSPKGTITLKASHQGGSIVIEVMDDGAGLNRERLLAKAKERGLSVHDAMPDNEVWQLIFAPGFSTAEVVTDVSGRGVGMDVVKKNIEGLGGRVELESSPGHGTRTIIRLPLTLAILDGMSVGVGDETYIVPLIAIIESLQPRRADIKTLAGDSRVVNIRGEYLPIIPLGEVFGGGGGGDLEQGIFVVVEAETGKAALFVDELLGQHQVVIKSLETHYRKVPGTSGATIMGDGGVAMILDVAAVTRMGLVHHPRHLAA